MNKNSNAKVDLESIARLQFKSDRFKLGRDLQKKSRRCNLCANHFRPKSRFERYCLACRQKNEAFKYGSWLPEMDDSLAVQFL